MKKSSSEQQSRIRKQFDSFCKTLLKNEMIDYERERNYRLKYEISFSELTQKELRQLEIMDDYIVESEMFHVFDYDIEVKDELIGEALKSLPEKKRNVILLSFFLDMTDTEIAKYMNLVRSTIHHHLHKFPLAGKPSAVIAFPLQDAPEALHGAIVNAMCNTGHRAFSCRHRVSSQTKASDHPGTMLSGKWKPPIKKWPVRSKSCSPHNQ